MIFFNVLYQLKTINVQNDNDNDDDDLQESVSGATEVGEPVEVVWREVAQREVCRAEGALRTEVV